MAALEAAAAATTVAAQVAAGDNGAVRKWLDGVLEQVVMQAAGADRRGQSRARVAQPRDAPRDCCRLCRIFEKESPAVRSREMC